MEAIYFFSYDVKKTFMKTLEDDFFKRLGYTLRECKSLGSERQGFFVCINTSAEMLAKIDELLEASGPVEKLSGKELEEITAKIKAEEEAAETGIGAIFG